MGQHVSVDETTAAAAAVVADGIGAPPRGQQGRKNHHNNYNSNNYINGGGSGSALVPNGRPIHAPIRVRPILKRRDVNPPPVVASTRVISLSRMTSDREGSVSAHNRSSLSSLQSSHASQSALLEVGEMGANRRWRNEHAVQTRGLSYGGGENVHQSGDETSKSRGDTNGDTHSTTSITRPSNHTARSEVSVQNSISSNSSVDAGMPHEAQGGNESADLLMQPASSSASTAMPGATALRFRLTPLLAVDAIPETIAVQPASSSLGKNVRRGDSDCDSESTASALDEDGKESCADHGSSNSSDFDPMYDRFSDTPDSVRGDNSNLSRESINTLLGLHRREPHPLDKALPAMDAIDDEVRLELLGEQLQWAASIQMFAKAYLMRKSVRLRGCVLTSSSNGLDEEPDVDSLALRRTSTPMERKVLTLRRLDRLAQTLQEGGRPASPARLPPAFSKDSVWSPVSDRSSPRRTYSPLPTDSGADDPILLIPVMSPRMVDAQNASNTTVKHSGSSFYTVL